MEAKLLPCPFCGGMASEQEIEPHSHHPMLGMPDHPGSYVIECGCGCGLIDDTRELVVARWQARAQLPASAPSVSVDEELLTTMKMALGCLVRSEAIHNQPNTDAQTRLRAAIQRAEASKEPQSVELHGMWHESDLTGGATDQPNPERECITCGQKGHWYLNCPTKPFVKIIAESFGLPKLMGDERPSGELGKSAEQEKKS